MNSRIANHPSQMFTIASTAEYLGCSQDTIRRMIARGELKAYRYGKSRLIRIDPADLDKIRKPVTRINEMLGGAA